MRAPLPGFVSPVAFRSLVLTTLAFAFAGIAAAGCSGAPGDYTPEAVGSSAQAITGATIVARADEWVSAKLLYCQSPNGVADPDPSCPSVCVREKNSMWDPYRSDCSGFVSWAWDLPAPGRTTDEFAPADTTVSFAIKGSDLMPGDALNVPADHMILFVAWVTKGSEATFYEEPGCSATPDYAHSFNSAVTISGSDVYVAYEGKSFTAIRYNGSSGGDGGVVIPPESGSTADAGWGPCTVTMSGEMGECMDTTACSSMGGMSTPDYCPGPANVQCCTGIPPATTDSGPPPPPPPPPSDGGMTVTADSGMKAPGPDGGVLPPPPPPSTGSSGESTTGGTNETDKVWRQGGGCEMAPLSSSSWDGSFLLGLGASATMLRRKRRVRGD